MQIPFKTLKADVKYKDQIGLKITKDDFFIQNNIRQLQDFIEAPESREIDEIMQFLTQYAKTPSTLDQKMMLPKVEFVEGELIKHIETAKQREAEVQTYEAEIKEALAEWKKTAEPNVQKIYTLADELNKAISELDTVCHSMYYSKGRGTTSRHNSLTTTSLAGFYYDELKEALRKFEKRA